MPSNNVVAVGEEEEEERQSWFGTALVLHRRLSVEEEVPGAIPSLDLATIFQYVNQIEALPGAVLDAFIRRLWVAISAMVQCAREASLASASDISRAQEKRISYLLAIRKPTVAIFQRANLLLPYNTILPPHLDHPELLISLTCLSSCDCPETNVVSYPFW